MFYISKMQTTRKINGPGTYNNKKKTQNCCNAQLLRFTNICSFQLYVSNLLYLECELCALENRWRRRLANNYTSKSLSPATRRPSLQRCSCTSHRHRPVALSVTSRRRCRCYTRCLAWCDRFKLKKNKSKENNVSETNSLECLERRLAPRHRRACWLLTP